MPRDLCPCCGENYRQHRYRELLTAFADDDDAYRRILVDGFASPFPEIRKIAWETVADLVDAGDMIAKG